MASAKVVNNSATKSFGTQTAKKSKANKYHTQKIP